MKLAIQAFFRNFKKRKTIYLITLIGFGISLAVFILITSFIIDENSYDKHLPYIDNMYRARYSDNAGIPKRYYEQLKENIPEIERVGMYDKNGFKFKYNEKPYRAQYLGVSEECIELFDIKFIKGNEKTLFQAKTGIAVTESFSKKIFGDINPIGEEINIYNEKRMITAIVNDPLKTFSLQYDFLWHNDYNTGMSLWCYGKYPHDCYSLLETAFVINKKTDLKQIEKKINEELKDCKIYDEDKIFLQKFEDIYFDTSAGFDGHEKANNQIIKLLSIVAIIVLILAIINYINLTSASNKARFKEICIRRTSGAQGKSIIIQFLSESYIACVISLVFGLILLVFFSSAFDNIFGKEFNLSHAFKHTSIILTLPLIILFVGGISGIIPAIKASFYTPIELVQQKSKIKKIGAKGIFNTIQFIVAISLIMCLILIQKQLKFVKTKDFGFDKEYLLNLRLEDLDERIPEIRDKLYENPNIFQVSASEGRPFKIRRSGSSTVEFNGQEYKMDYMKFLKTDWNFLKTFDIPIVYGRDFKKSDKNVCLINEHFFNEMGFKSIDNLTIGKSKVIGVFKDIHYEKLYNDIGKLQVTYEPNKAEHDELNVRINSVNIHETISYIESVLKSFDPHFMFYYEFYDDFIERLYEQEEKQAKTVKIFAFLAIFLSCLGLYGMVEFSCKEKIKEIGIRKVNGAKNLEILSMLNTDFVKWIVVSFIFSCPIAWYAMKRWLENFAYKTEISWWIFGLSGIIVLVISFFTASWQTWQTARRNPIESLRYE